MNKKLILHDVHKNNNKTLQIISKTQPGLWILFIITSSEFTL